MKPLILRTVATVLAADAANGRAEAAPAAIAAGQGGGVRRELAALVASLGLVGWFAGAAIAGEAVRNLPRRNVALSRPTLPESGDRHLAPAVARAAGNVRDRAGGSAKIKPSAFEQTAIAGPRRGESAGHGLPESGPDDPISLPAPAAAVPLRSRSEVAAGSAADLRPNPTALGRFGVLPRAQSGPIPPAPLPDDRPEPELPEPLPPLDELLPPLPPADTDDPAAPPPGEIPETIVVLEFRVEGSTVFDAEDFEPVLEPFRDRPLTFAELLEARAAVTQLYIDNGYATSGALLPPQTIEDGTVVIQVIEGRLEAIEITGLERLQENYVRSRLERATRPPLNLDRLLEALQLLQLDPLVETISAELSAGINPGENLLQVAATEADAFDFTVVLDNGRSPAVGSFRRQASVRHGNLVGWGDPVQLTYTNTDGSNEVDFSYSVPINARNGTVGTRVSYSDSNIIEDPFDPLDLESESLSYEFFFRQPIVLEPTRELALGISFSRQESQTFLLDTEFPLSPGADDRGRTRISTLRLFQEWTQRDAQHVLALRSQFSFGLDWFSPTINRRSPDGEFFTWRGQAQWVRLLGDDALLLLRSDVQLADRPLVPLEQMALGGLDTVRGYRQDRLLTDSGLFASAEVRLPVLRVPDIDGVLQVTPFLDFGTGWNRGDRPDPDPETLASVGLGLRWQHGDNFTARFEWGIPLIEDDATEKDTLQEEGLYFSIRWTPF